MARYDYARVSTAEHDGTRQEQSLRAAGGAITQAEKGSGSRRAAAGLGASAMARCLGIGRASAYRARLRQAGQQASRRSYEGTV
jgi:hypothetical protein